MFSKCINRLFPIVGLPYFFVFFDELILDWFLAGEDDRPQHEDAEPDTDEDGTGNHQSIDSDILGVVVNDLVFNLSELQSHLNILLLTFFRHADPCEGLDVIGAVLEPYKEVVVRVSDHGLVLTFVFLSRVISGDARVHYRRQRQSSVVLGQDASFEG